MKNAKYTVLSEKKVTKITLYFLLKILKGTIRRKKYLDRIYVAKHR